MAELRRTEGSERVDVLKLGHHGSELSLTSEQARRLSPVLAVASAGEGNSYGHPSQEAIQAVEAAGARFLCTIGEGDIKIRP